jgi:hypothetical protein
VYTTGAATLLQGGSGLTIPGYNGPPVDLIQILPLEDKQVLTALCQTATGTQVVIRLPALVAGVYWDGNLGYKNVGTKDARLIYWGDWSLDRELGIVQFSDAVVKRNAADDGSSEPADLILRTSFPVRDAQTWTYDRYTVQTPTGLTNGTGPKVLLHDETTLYVDATGQPVNQDAVDQEADYYTTVSLLEYQTPLPQERLYEGLLDLVPDGAVQQITWAVGPGGCTTRVARNNEFSVGQQPYPMRRLFEMQKGDVLRRLTDNMEALDKALRQALDWRK